MDKLNKRREHDYAFKAGALRVARESSLTRVAAHALNYFMSGERLLMKQFRAREVSEACSSGPLTGGWNKNWEFKIIISYTPPTP